MLKQIWAKCFGSKGLTASICGHETTLVGKVTAFGASTTTTMPRNQKGSTNYCLECIGKMAIRCAWCAEPIFIGDPITLYSPMSERMFDRFLSRQEEFPFVLDTDLGFRIPAHAVVYQRKPLQLVGCLRWACADSGADRAGFWVPETEGKGTVYRVKTAYEEILSGKEMVVVSDLNDSKSASPLTGEGESLPVARRVP